MSALLAAGAAWQSFVWPWLLETTCVTALLLPVLRWGRLSPRLRGAVATIAVLQLLMPWAWRPSLPWRFPSAGGIELATAGTADTVLTLLGVVAGVHLAGVVAALAIGARRLLRATSLRASEASVAREPALCALVAELASQIGLRRAPSVHLTTRVAAPCVVGLRRPAVLLPPDVAGGLDDPELRAVLAHELLHIRHLDLWRCGLRALASAVWWFHPLARRVLYESAELDELRCDDSVVAGRLAPADVYRAALLEVAALASRAPARLPLVAATGAHRLPLARRLFRLSRDGVTRNLRLGLAEWLAVSLLAVGMLARFAEPAEGPPARPTTSNGVGVDGSVLLSDAPLARKALGHAAAHREAHLQAHRAAHRASHRAAPRGSAH